MDDNNKQDQLHSLKEENSMLKVELETTEEILKVTEEIVLNQNKDLQETNEKLKVEMSERKKMQEALLKAERLAAFGETSGRVAHEVLNPISSIFSRVEHNINELEKFKEIFDTMREVINDWFKEYKSGTFLKYLKEQDKDGKSYGDEEFHLIKTLIDNALTYQQTRESDLSHIYKQLCRVIRIINTLRESINTQRNVTEIEVAYVIDEAFEILEDSLKKRNITIIKDISSNFHVISDENEMIQVFTNLFRNAMQSIDEKRSKEGLLNVTASLNGENVEIIIKDNGKGVSREFQDNIFDFAFTTKDRKAGTGLGLGISRRFVRESGGELVLAESTEGAGSTFLVTLPAVKE